MPLNGRGPIGAARQTRSLASEPGEVDGAVVERGLAHFQISPDFHRCLGFLDIFEKRPFRVIAPPAPGLEQFGEMFQPLLGKAAPARNNIATCPVYTMCHEPARKEKNGRRRNRDESTAR